MTEDLRKRLARIDPARRLDDLAESPTAHEIRERVMRTIEETPTPTPVATPRRLRLVAGLAASVAAVAVAAAVLGGDDKPQVTQRTPTTMALKAPAAEGGPSMSSCVMFSVDILRDMPVALAGTAVSVTPDSVTIDVDRWYKGGSADQVTIATPGATTSVALDGVEFTQGTRYLITATDGTVNTCGFSGPATAELERAFAEAFTS